MKRTRRIKLKNIVCNERRAHNGHFMNVERCTAHFNRALGVQRHAGHSDTSALNCSAVTYWDPLNEIKMKNHVDSPLVRNQFYKIFNIYFVGVAFTGVLTANGEKKRETTHLYLVFPMALMSFWHSLCCAAHTHSPTQLSTMLLLQPQTRANAIENDPIKEKCKNSSFFLISPLFVCYFFSSSSSSSSSC